MHVKPMPKPLPMHLSPRCRAKTRRGNSCPQPATPKGRCRMHGGAAGSGAPSGPRNGNYRHGLRTQEAMAERKMLRAWVKASSRFPLRSRLISSRHYVAEAKARNFEGSPETPHLNPSSDLQGGYRGSRSLQTAVSDSI